MSKTLLALSEDCLGRIPKVDNDYPSRQLEKYAETEVCSWFSSISLPLPFLKKFFN